MSRNEMFFILPAYEGKTYKGNIQGQAKLYINSMLNFEITIICYIFNSSIVLQYSLIQQRKMGIYIPLGICCNNKFILGKANCFKETKRNFYLFQKKIFLFDNIQMFFSGTKYTTKKVVIPYCIRFDYTFSSPFVILSNKMLSIHNEYFAERDRHFL